MTWLCLPRPKALADPMPVPPRGLGAGEGLGSPVHPCVSPSDCSRAQLLDSVLGLGTLGLTVRAVFSMAGPALLLLLLLVSFLAFDVLHRPTGPTVPQHRLLTRGQSQGAGEGPGQQEAVLPAGTVTGQLSLQDALLLLLMGLGLLLGARGMPAALLGLAFCLHPWA
uniref:Chromosome 20 open reading frame 141 n=1 Tax=Prolemur simus TaxID=1328070 RepID=A0A8C9A6N6_PROSS